MGLGGDIFYSPSFHQTIVLATTQQKNCGLYYKPMTILNDNSRVITKLET